MKHLRLACFVFCLLLISCSELSSNQRTAASDAIKSLKKIQAATQVGSNYQQYGLMVIDAKAQVNEAVSVLPDGELKKEISAAMDAYADAREGWGESTQSGGVGANSDLGQRLIGKYKVQPAYFLDKDDILHKTWSAAKSHLDRADSLLK